MDDAVRFLFQPNPYLKPFIIIHHGIVQGIVYGDVGAIHIRSDILPSGIDDAYYITLHITTNEPFSPRAFSFVWRYLNGLDGDILLLDLLMHMSYYLPLRDRSARPPRPSYVRPIEAQPYFTAFNIAASEGIVGKWLFSLISQHHDCRFIIQVIAQMGMRVPSAFFPPLTVTDDYTSMYDYDTDYFGVMPPPSIRSFATREIDTNEVLARYLTGRHRLTGEVGLEKPFAEPMIMTIDNKVCECISYTIIRAGDAFGLRVLFYTLAAVAGGSVTYATRYLNGKWDPDVTPRFYQRGARSLTEDNLAVDEIDVKYLVTTRASMHLTPTGNTTFIINGEIIVGNPVVMMSRSAYIAGIVEAGGVSPIEINLVIGDRPTFLLLWSWMNNNNEFSEAKDYLVDYHQMWLYLDYFLVPITSSFVNIFIYGLAHAADDHHLTLFTDAVLLKLSNAVNLQPLSRQTLITTPIKELVFTARGRVLTLPYKYHLTVTTDPQVNDIILFPRNSMEYSITAIVGERLLCGTTAFIVIPLEGVSSEVKAAGATTYNVFRGEIVIMRPPEYHLLDADRKLYSISGTPWVAREDDGQYTLVGKTIRISTSDAFTAVGLEDDDVVVAPMIGLPVDCNYLQEYKALPGVKPYIAIWEAGDVAVPAG